MVTVKDIILVLEDSINEQKQGIIDLAQSDEDITIEVVRYAGIRLQAYEDICEAIKEQL